MKSHKYFVYLLRCSDNSYYTGVTNDLERRLKEHNSAINPECYTACRLPIEIVYAQDFQYIDKAIAFEKQIKGWSRKKKEALIDSNWDELVRLSRKKFV